MKDANAIIIPAHLHSTRDAFRSRSVDDIYADPEFLRHARDHFTALEVTDLKTAEYFDGKHPEALNILRTCIRSSDAHEAALLGTRVTYAQMEAPSFTELKSALELPFRISLIPPEGPTAYVVGIQIRGQFYPDLWMSFSPHCNALIGVKGSGKTSLLECLRFALGAPVPASRQESVANHLQTILGGSGSVRVLMKRADGARLVVERSLQSQDFKVTFDDNRHEVFAGPEGLLFPSYILGWHEIEQAATDANIRQIYLDTIAGRDQIRSLHEEAEVAAKQIRHLHEVASIKYSTFRSLHDQVRRLEELRRGLQELTDGNLVTLRDQYEAAIRHRDAVEGLRRALQSAHDEVDSRVNQLGVTADKASLGGASPIARHALEAHALVDGLGKKLSEFAGAHKKELQEIISRIDALMRKAINSDFDVFYKEYEAKVSALPPEKKRLLDSPLCANMTETSFPV